MDGIRVDESHAGYAFGPFVVDAVKRQLWREGSPVPITSKTFDVLIVLLEHRNHIVSKDELLSRVWPEISVNENNLARQISSLRRALGQRPDQHDFLVTVPGQGYRFVAGVQDLTDVRPERHPIRDIEFHETLDAARECEAGRNGDEPLREQQPEPGPSTIVPDSDTSSRRWGWRQSIGTLAATSLGILATTVAVMLLRSTDPNSAASTNPAARHL